MNKTLLATTALAFVAASASAVDVELYGQVNKGVFGFDDGAYTDYVVVDNDLSGTRMGLKGAQALDNGLTASVLFEFESQSNPSDTFTQNNTTNVVTTTSNTPTNSMASFVERQARVGLSGNWGGAYVGMQSTATDGIYETDLAGAQDVMTSDFGLIGGGLAFRRDNATQTTTGTATIAGMTQSVAVSRANSVRYDSPIVAGFQGRVAVAQGGDMDAALVYEGGFGDFTVAGAAGVYFNNDTAGNPATIAARTEQSTILAGSVKHSSGLAATLAYTTADIEGKTAAESEPEAWYAKVGYAWDVFEVAADYGKSENYNNLSSNLNDDLTSYGLAAQMDLGHGVSVAALYRNFDADLAVGGVNASTESIDLYGVNMRVKF